MSRHLQLTIFAAVAGLISLASIVYPFVHQSEYLRESREGTPFFTPPVIHPDTGEAIELDELIRHYKTGG
ncbi:MAG: hypothetical protein ACR2RB_15690 [Gammaproteobacteria bacterium]